MRYKIDNFAFMKQAMVNFWEIESNADFELCAMQTFHHQYKYNSVYRSYCDLIHFNPADLKSIRDIPFLPIHFFKSHEVKSFSEPEAITFTSSGTTGTETSKHFVKEIKGYEKSFTKASEIGAKRRGTIPSTKHKSTSCTMGNDPKHSLEAASRSFEPL